MRRLFNGSLVAAAIVGVLGLYPMPLAAEQRAGDDSAGWVPAISAFSGLVSSSRVEPATPSAWAEPEKPIVVGDTVEIIQVIMLPESVAIAAGVPDAAARYVIEKQPESDGSSGVEERWVLAPAEPGAAGTQRADGSPPRASSPTDSIDGAGDLLVEPPAARTDLAAAPAEAAAPRDETERWVPSFAVFSGVVAADLEADVESGIIATRNFYDPIFGPTDPFPFNGPFDFPNTRPNERFKGPEPVRPAARGDDLNLEPFIGGQLELMTPGLQKVPGRPRLYVAGDASWSFGFNRDVAKEGAPSQMNPEWNPLRPSKEPEWEGQGSRATSLPQNLVIGANAGMAFTLDLGDRRLRIKPNVGYLRQDLELNGSVNRVLLINAGRNNPGDVPDYPEVWETIKIQGEDEQVYHSLGPGLELELDAARVGPIVLALFATGNAYKVVSGERTIEFEGTGTWENYLPTLGALGGGTQTRTETARWKFVKEPWTYRGAVGLRFRWVPE